MSKVPLPDNTSQNTRRIFRTPEAAGWLGVASSTLEKWRLTGQGPKFIRLSARVIGYFESDLEAFAAARTHASTSEAIK